MVGNIALWIKHFTLPFRNFSSFNFQIKFSYSDFKDNILDVLLYLRRKEIRAVILHTFEELIDSKDDRYEENICTSALWLCC